MNWEEEKEATGKLRNRQGRTQGRDFGDRNPSLLEVKATLLLTDIVMEVSCDNIHSGSNQ